MSYYMHNVPGRLRIKSPVIKNNKNIVNELKKALSMLDGVAVVDINTTTGSVLINYNYKKIKHKDILEFLQRKGYFDISKAMSNDEYIHKTAEKIGTVVGKSIFNAFVGSALERTPLSFLSILL